MTGDSTRSRSRRRQSSCRPQSWRGWRWAVLTLSPHPLVNHCLAIAILMCSPTQEISELVSSCLSSPLRREKLATAIENDNYIKKLLNIFTVCEVIEKYDREKSLQRVMISFKRWFSTNTLMIGMRAEAKYI